MRIAICDDDRQERLQLMETIKNLNPMQTAEQFEDGESLLRAAIIEPHFSIVFLDIYMPGSDGVETAKRLKAISPETGIVFTTTSSEHAVQAFAVNAVHYIVKPVSEEDIRESFRRIQKMQLEEDPIINIKSDYGSHRLYQKEIIKLSSCNHETMITLEDNRTIKTYMSISQLSKELSDSFIQIQRGLIVRMDYIEKMNYDRCLLRDGQTVLLSRKDRAVINNTYNEFVFRQITDKADGRWGNSL